MRALLLLLLLATACEDGTESPVDAGSTVDAGPAACTSFANDNDKLHNAPTTATTIKKTPTHPPLVNGELP